jgi:hypothetical protein
MRFPAQRNMFLFGSFIGLMILLIFILWVVAQLRLVFRSIRNGQPFLPVNAIRIRRIGIAVILGELTRAIATYLSNYYAMMHFSANGIQFTAPIDISVIALVHGLIIIVIAEVFRMGSQLQEDQSLTV